MTYWFSFHGGDTVVPAAAFDTTIVNADNDTTRVAFDHASGRVSLDAVSREWAGIRVLERLDVVGVPAGTALPATVVFELEGEVVNICGGGGCGTYFGATVAGASDSVMVDESILGPCMDCTRPVSTTLSLPVILTAGTPLDVAFAMLYRTTNVGWGKALISGSYRVSGLPAGVTAVTCAGADVTPVQRATWGSLKARYR